MASNLRPTCTAQTACRPHHGWKHHLLPGQGCLKQLRRLSHLLHSQCPRKTLLQPDGQFHHQIRAEGSKLRRSSGLTTEPSGSRNPVEQLKIVLLASAFGRQLQLEELPSNARAGFPASRRHHNNTSIGDQHKHCMTVLGATRLVPLEAGPREIRRRKKPAHTPQP